MMDDSKRSRFLRLPSPAMTVACIALAIALSGASYAAVVLPRNSVGTAQLKQNAVTSVKIKNSSVTGLKIRDNSVTGADIREATLGTVPKAADADRLDGVDSSGFVQGTGKTYVGRVVLPTSNPFPDDVVLTVPAFATVRALNCQAGGANVSLGDLQQTRGTFTMWRDTGGADPDYFSSPSTLSWNSNFQVTERTTWHLSVGTGATAEAATIDVHTRVDGANCIYTATAQVWGR